MIDIKTTSPTTVTLPNADTLLTGYSFELKPNKNGYKIVIPSSETIIEHEKCIGILQSQVNNLRWRMNEVCNLLSLKREEVGNTITATCCATHAGGYEECKPSKVDVDNCQHTWNHGELSPTYCSKCGAKPVCEHVYKKTLSKSGMYFVKTCSKCNDQVAWRTEDECQHESDGCWITKGPLGSAVSRLKCIKCGEFFR